MFAVRVATKAVSQMAAQAQALVGELDYLSVVVVAVVAVKMIVVVVLPRLSDAFRTPDFALPYRVRVAAMSFVLAVLALVFSVLLCVRAVV